jgi:outer membrane immunogenic protein
MKRAVILGIGLLAMAGAPVMAADIPVKAARPAPVIAPAAYDWTGIYSATSVGVQWWDIEGAYVNTGLPDRHNTRGARFNSGSHLGAQYQFGSWVIGVEGSYNTGYNPSFTTSNSIGADCLGASALAARTCESRIRNYWTAGGKLGYAWDNWMIYAIGGYANGRIETQTTITGTGVLTSHTSARHSGWFAGAGVDFFVTKLWLSDLIIGIEYTHIDLGTKLHVDDLPGATGINNRNVKATDDTVRLKLTSKFNWAPAAVVARY